jgi:hypothetical protein
VSLEKLTNHVLLLQVDNQVSVQVVLRQASQYLEALDEAKAAIAQMVLVLGQATSNIPP